MSEMGAEKTTGPDQKDTLFCWLFAIANSIKASMWAKLEGISTMDIPPGYSRRYRQESDQSIVLLFVCNEFLDRQTPSSQEARKFLCQKDLTRIIRREICFGLVPKTLKCKSTETRFQSKLEVQWLLQIRQR